MCALLYQQISREKALRPRFPSGSAEDALQGRGNRREQTCERHSVMGFSRPRREQWASPWMRAPAFPCVWWKRSEEHTSELQSLMRISYAVFCLKKKKTKLKYTKVISFLT